jgi:hypothetical protein
VMGDRESLEERISYERAERIVSEKIGFLRHLLVFVVVNAVLLTVNLLMTTRFLWFLFPLGIWGTLLLAHFVSVFMFRGGVFERWRRKQVEKEMERLRRRE